MNKLTQQASLGDFKARATIYKIFSENYQQEFDCWTKKLYPSKCWVDKDDIKQDIFMDSVDYHIENYKYYNLSIPDDYLIKKSIKQAIWQYVNKQTTERGVCLTEPHICIKPQQSGKPVRLKSECISFDRQFPVSEGILAGLPDVSLKDVIPDPNIKDPLDKLIYEEFIDIMFDKVKYYQPKYSYDLSKILILLLEGENSTHICRKMGIDSSKKMSNAITYLKKIKLNVFLPLALSIIDDEIYTNKYWDVLSKKAKTLFFSQKNT